MMRNKKSKKSTLREYVEAFAIAGVLAFTIRTFVFQAFKIPSGSMMPTLLIGDHIIVEKFLLNTILPFSQKHLREIRHGDIIVFEYPDDPSKDYIKRVIGLPGDTVEISDGVLLINSIPVRQEKSSEELRVSIDKEGTIYTEKIDSVVHSILQNNPRPLISLDYGPITVPPDSYFVMGDNRDNSSDSRVWGFVRTTSIKGKAFMIYWSWGNDDGFRWERLGRIVK